MVYRIKCIIRVNIGIFLNISCDILCEGTNIRSSVNMSTVLLHSIGRKGYHEGCNAISFSLYLVLKGDLRTLNFSRTNFGTMGGK